MTSSGDIRSGVRFNVREFTRTARGNHRDELHLDEFASAPLSDESLHAVRYLGRLESATMEHLRNLLVTATHKDARVTAFLVTWAFEKFWIADALDAVLEANGQPRAQAIEEGRTRTAHADARDRRGPIRRAVSAIRQGVPIIAVHMTTGLIDEWITRTAYERLSAVSKSPALAATIQLILDVKERHARFFDDEARRRLSESPRAVKLTRTELLHAVWPIGAVDRADSDRSFFERFVFGGSEGADRAALIGTRVAALPGMDARIGSTVAQRLLP
ncbi:hypothetical protein [Galbitalea soli]|uniref:Uncharacterized protein n=1 Tax=Galbitalea soli TaxID=1268042 RepID=A0A7C9TQF0_9MICO|nr:hypothetical protein [Galbitalea soli]NEM91416.1 hypothetical protein [Galbitalea soli]NYJ30109.1 hypothetical protein [Galbitalea soli]